MKLKDKFVIKISTGIYHTMALIDNGDLYAWGASC